MKYHIALTVNVLFFSAYICPHVEPEVFSAIAHLGQLLHTNRVIADVLDSYLALEDKRLRKLRWLQGQYKQMHEAARKNQEAFVTNPVNAFVLVKRLSQDWEKARFMIEGAPSRALVQNEKFWGFPFPDEEDLNGAAAALLRLQETYLLDTSQLAKGEVAGQKSNTELTAGDCYQLGHQAFVSKDYERAILWLQEALLRVEEEEIDTTNKPLILELMAECAFELRNVTQAVELTRQIISIVPQHPGVKTNLIRYENILKTKGDNFISEENDENNFHISDNENHEYEFDDYSGEDYVLNFENYEKLCRGENMQSPRAKSQLKCRYTTNGDYYLLLQPVKQEILSLDPFICIYLDVISDKDIELFKRISWPRLSRASVVDPETGLEEAVDFRVSKSTWLRDDMHPRIAYASKVLKGLTGLETHTAEDLHVINYGIGGHYGPHYDFSREGEAESPVNVDAGNRMATLIYYFTNVEAGGATVFPKVGVAVKPKKGSAAFWYNLRKSGAGDLNTLHAGCPVLAGTKWVGNRWFHEHGNEFRRKCSLKPWE